MMLHSAGTVAGLAGISLVLASFVASGSAQSTDRAVANVAAVSNLGGKGDRAPVAAPSRPASRVTSVELVGLSRTTVILRDRDGTVVYQSDPLTNTTLVAKNADIPTVTIKDAAGSETEQRPVAQQQPARRIESKEPPAPPSKRAMPIGCEGIVSILVNQDSRRVPGLCLS